MMEKQNRGMIYHIGQYWSRIFNLKREIEFAFSNKVVVKRNRELENLYSGKRCFILGNGQSIRQQDLSNLKNEIVFVTNDFVRYDRYRDVRPNYYLIMDPIIYKRENELGKKSTEKIFSIKEMETKPVFFFPYKAKKIIEEEYKWDQWADIYYIDDSLTYIDGQFKKYNLSKPVPCFGAVVLYAAIIAVYMGFKEIYMLGIEQTNIIDHINAYLGEDITRYAFSYGKEQQELQQRILTLNSLETTLSGYVKIFHMYGEVYKICQKCGVEMYNCTPKSLVKDMPKRNFDELSFSE